MRKPEEAALAQCLLEEYGFNARDIHPASRGFYGLTWKAVTDGGALFLKADPWPRHHQGFRGGLLAVRFLMDRGIGFVPALHQAKDGRLSVPFGDAVLAVFDFLEGEPLEHAGVAQQYGQLARVYRLGTEGLSLPREDFRASFLNQYKQLLEEGGLPGEALRALEEKAALLSHVENRLRAFPPSAGRSLTAFTSPMATPGATASWRGRSPSWWTGTAP